MPRRYTSQCHPRAGTNDLHLCGNSTTAGDWRVVVEKSQSDLFVGGRCRKVPTAKVGHKPNLAGRDVGDIDERCRKGGGCFRDPIVSVEHCRRIPGAAAKKKVVAHMRHVFRLVERRAVDVVERKVFDD